MKVLITGGYGFIGSHIAERCYKEGYQISIIDNLSSGCAKNISFKHKFYNMDVTDRKCEEIFKSNRFDFVIHLAAQTSAGASMKNPYSDADTNILGLINMLTFAHMYDVKKFIFISSAAVYGNNSNLPLKEEYEGNPISPYGMSKLTGELYCKKWSEIYGLKTLCVRLSNVYGPRQRSGGDSGVIPIFMERAFQGKSLEVFGDGKATRDFVYVEDVADAVYRSLECETSQVLNISTQNEICINDLIETLKSFTEIKEVDYNEKRDGDIERSSLDNTKAKRELDWVPMYSMKDGLEKTLKWYISNSAVANEEIASAVEVKAKKTNSKLIPFLENILIFMLISFVSVITRYNADFNIFDFKLMYIILMGIAYGTMQSTIAVGLSIALYMSLSLSVGRDLVSLIYDPNSLLQISIYIIVGLSIGYTIDKKNREIQFKDMKVSSMEERYNFLNDIYNEVRYVKDELQKQIASSEHSFGKLYDMIREIDSLEPEYIFNASVDLLENVMKSRSVCIYIISKNNQFLRLVAKSKDMNMDVSKSMRISDIPEIEYVIKTRNIFINKDLNPKLPAMAAPIADNDKVIAIVCIQNVKFENLTLYYQNLFKVVSSLISSSLSKAYRYEEATFGERYISGTNVLKFESFKKILDFKKQAKDGQKNDFSVLMLDEVNLEDRVTINTILGAIRDIDYIGVGKDCKLYVILSNSKKQEADIVIDRLKAKSVKAVLVDEWNEVA